MHSMAFNGTEQRYGEMNVVNAMNAMNVINSGGGWFWREKTSKRVVECCLCGINNEDDTRCMFSYVMLCCVSYIGRTWPLFTTS